MENLKKKILILGSTGMLGHQVFSIFENSPEFTLIDLVYRSKLRSSSILCDVINKNDVVQIISNHKPNFIINCIGVLIKGSYSNPANAIYINSYFPHFLKQEADKIGSKVIHISTDCVFSGKKGKYTESDLKDSDDIYGRSKALGELNEGPHLTIRTSIIGPELKEDGEGLFHWFINQTGKVNGFTKTIWGGVTTLECAKAIKFSILNDINGIVNLTNGQGISKFNLLSLLASCLSKNKIKIIPVEGKSVDKSLISERIDFTYKIPSYETMFKEMIFDLQKNILIYMHYSSKL
jgi:dTDP-4-dehydrorhamnose reductase